jgi:hypothetical protein
MWATRRIRGRVAYLRRSSTCEFRRFDHNRCGPLGDRGRITQGYDLAFREMNNQTRFGSVAGVRIRFVAVVVHAKLRQIRKHSNQVQDTAGIALTDFFLWDIVSPAGDARADARDVKLHARQAYIPDADLNACRQRFFEQGWDRVSAKSGLKDIIQALGHRSLKRPPSLMPGGALGVCLRDAGIGSANAPGSFVGIEVLGPLLDQHLAPDAALAGAVRTGQNVDPGDAGFSSHACAPRRPQPSPIASLKR